MDSDEAIPLTSYSRPSRHTPGAPRVAAKVYSSEYESVLRKRGDPIVDGVASTSNIHSTTAPLIAESTQNISTENRQLMKQRCADYNTWIEETLVKRTLATFKLNFIITFPIIYILGPFIICPWRVLTGAHRFLSFSTLFYTLVASIAVQAFLYIRVQFSSFFPRKRSMRVALRATISSVRNAALTYVLAPLAALIFLWASAGIAGSSTSSLATQSFTYHGSTPVTAFSFLSPLVSASPLTFLAPPNAVSSHAPLVHRICVSHDLRLDDGVSLAPILPAHTYSPLPPSSFLPAFIAATGATPTELAFGASTVVAPNPLPIYKALAAGTLAVPAHVPTHAPAVPLTEQLLARAVLTDTLTVAQNDEYRPFYIDATATFVLLLAAALALLLALRPALARMGAIPAFEPAIPADAANAPTLAVLAACLRPTLLPLAADVGVVLVLAALVHAPLSATLLPAILDNFSFLFRVPSQAYSHLLTARGISAAPTEMVISASRLCPDDASLAYVPALTAIPLAALMPLILAAALLVLLSHVSALTLALVETQPVRFGATLPFALTDANPRHRALALAYVIHAARTAPALLAPLYVDAPAQPSLKAVCATLLDTTVLNAARAGYSWLFAHNAALLQALKSAGQRVPTVVPATPAAAAALDVSAVPAPILRSLPHPDTSPLVALADPAPARVAVDAVTVLLTLPALVPALNAPPSLALCIGDALSALAQLDMAIDDYRAHLARIYTHQRTTVAGVSNSNDASSNPVPTRPGRSSIATPHPSVIALQESVQHAIRILCRSHPQRVSSAPIPADVATTLQKYVNDAQ